MASDKKKPAARAGAAASRRPSGPTTNRRLVLLAALAAIVVAAALALSAGDEADDDPAGGDNNDVPEEAADGLLRTGPPWPPQYDGLEERVEAAGFPPVGDESYHVHALLSVFVDGRQVEVPPDIGIDRQRQFLSPLHTHGTNGVVHFEADDPSPFTLGQVFDVWGVAFDRDRLGDRVDDGSQTVQVFVNGVAVDDPRSRELAEADNIVVAFGEEGSFPTQPPTGALENP